MSVRILKFKWILFNGRALFGEAGMMRPSIHQQVTFIFTEDLESSAHFYRNVLNLELALDQGTCQIYRISRDGFLGVCYRQGILSQNDAVIFTLVTDQVDEWYQFLVDQNIHIDDSPTVNTKYNIYHMFLRDPNGYLLEIQEFLSPDWPV